MSSITIHILGSFLTLLLVNRLFKLETPLENLLFFSLFSLLPDLIDKPLTGSRYPAHSLVILFTGLLVINLIIRFSDRKELQMGVLLISIAILTHPILDLQGSIPLFYPLINTGFSIDFNIVIKQGLPPIITVFNIQIIQSTFDYNITYENEGSLVNTQDFIILSLLIFPLMLKGIIVLVNAIKTKLNNH